jgi:hypothetical protein
MPEFVPYCDPHSWSETFLQRLTLKLCLTLEWRTEHSVIFGSISERQAELWPC